MWRNTYQHMDMIRTCFCLDDFYSFLLTLLSQYFSNILFDLSIDFFPSVLWRKHYMILTPIL